MLCYLLLAVICSTWLNVSADETYSAATLKKIAELDELIDDTVNPCDDFQKYVCSRKKDTYLTEIGKKIDKLLKKRVTTGVRPDDQEAVKKFYDFYGKCKTVFDQRNATLKRLLKDVDSVFKDGNGRYLPFDATLIAKVAAYSIVNHGISFFVGPRYYKPLTRWFSQKEKLLYIGEFELSQSRLLYDPHILPNRKVEITKQFQRGISKLKDIGAISLTASKINETASTLFKFEEDMSKLLQYPEKSWLQKGKELQEVTVGEAITKFPEMDWKTYINSFVNYSGVDLLKGSKLEEYPLMLKGSKLEEYPLIIIDPDLVKALPKIVKMVSEDTLRMYIKLRVAIKFLLTVKKDPIADSCQAFAFGPFSLVQQYFLITEMLPKPEDRFEFKKSLGKLADDVLASAENMLEKISWIQNDNQTFAGFTDKKNKLTKVIGFPDELANQTWLDKQYKDFILDGADDLYSLYLKSMKFLLKTGMEGDFFTGQLSVVQANAFYSAIHNKFQINIGIVDDILYNPEYVPALNYGTLGAIIGHEVLHAFDKNGVIYDGDGYINTWISAKSKAKFDSMAQCVIDAYDKFNACDATGKVTRINGTFTLGENMSDIGGIRAAYMAFKKNPAHRQSFPKTKKLEKYTQEQLFFLAFGQYRCGGPSGDYMFYAAHSPSEIRILGTLQNFVPFREAFNCPVNSVYAPEKHCEVYTPDLDNGVSALIPRFIVFVIMALVN